MADRHRAPEMRRQQADALDILWCDRTGGYVPVQTEITYQFRLAGKRHDDGVAHPSRFEYLAIVTKVPGFCDGRYVRGLDRLLQRGSFEAGGSSPESDSILHVGVADGNPLVVEAEMHLQLVRTRPDLDHAENRI